MPAFGAGYSDAEIADIVKFVLAHFGGETAAIAPEEIRKTQAPGMSRGMRVTIALIAMCLTAQSPIDPRLEVVNQSDVPIYELLIKAEGTDTWSRLTLGIPIAPGEDRRVRMPTDTTCLFDIRAVYQDRRTEDRPKVDVCKNPAATFDAPQARGGDSR